MINFHTFLTCLTFQRVLHHGHRVAVTEFWIHLVRYEFKILVEKPQYKRKFRRQMG